MFAIFAMWTQAQGHWLRGQAAGEVALAVVKYLAQLESFDFGQSHIFTHKAKHPQPPSLWVERFEDLNNFGDFERVQLNASEFK